MKLPDPKRLNTQIYSEASDWLVEFRTGDIEPAGRKAFTQWLRISPEHVRAYLELAAMWNEGSRLDPERKFDDRTLLEAAMSESNIVPLELEQAPASGVSRLAGPSKAGPTAAVLSARLLSIAASVLILAVTATWWLSNQRGLYQTDVGEQRAITLPDGTHIELNARSRIRVRYDTVQRDIELLYGQAYFHVAKDTARPFIVASGNTRVRAVGTQFDVYRKTSGTVVTVVEGRVAIGAAGAVEAQLSDPGLPAPGLLLAAGEQLVVTAQAADRPVRADVAAATAWMQKRLVFQAAPLSEVAAEFNRYNQRPLVIASPELNDFRITGIFSSTNPASLIRFLDARPDVAITERDDDILVAREP